MSPMSPRLLRPRASGGFDPRTIANLAAWYDAADTANVTLNGSNVSQLTDKSGNGRNATQGSASLQPAYSTAKYNGKNVVTNAAAKVLTFSVPLNSAATVFLVCSRGTITNTRALCGNAAGAAPSFGVMIDAAADFSYYTPSGDTTTLVARDAAATGLHVMAFAQTDSVNLRAFFNGTQKVSRTPGLPFAPYALTLLGATFSNGNQAMNGDIAELLVYHKVLTDAERQQVEGYLAWKWGFQAQLPYNHPYAASFPGYGSQTMPTDSDAITYLAAVATADGGTGVEVGVANAVDAFIKGCKADGIWSAIKASCILSGARTLSGALVPLAGFAPSNVGSFVSGDYNRKTGLARASGTKYLDTNRASNADGQDNFHASAYCSVFNVGQTIFGATDGSTVIDSRLRYEFGALQTSARKQFSAGLSSDTAPFSGGAATFLGVRRSAGTGFRARFRGTNYDYNSATSAAPSALNTFIFALNDNGTAADNANQNRLMFYSVGESLDLALLDARVTALVTAIGAASQ